MRATPWTSAPRSSAPTPCPGSSRAIAPATSTWCARRCCRKWPNAGSSMRSMRSARASRSPRTRWRGCSKPPGALGLPVKLHADQLSDLGGAALAARFGALSADHLEYAGEEASRPWRRRARWRSCCPAPSTRCASARSPPVELFRRHGVPIALATDCNPGSSPIVSILAILNMACTLFGLTPEEALAGSPAMPPARSGWTIAARSRWASAPISPLADPSPGRAQLLVRLRAARARTPGRPASYPVPGVDRRLYQRQFATKISHKRSKGGREGERGPVGWAEETTEARGAESLRLQSAPAMVGRRPPDHPQLRSQPRPRLAQRGGGAFDRAAARRQRRSPGRFFAPARSGPRPAAGGTDPRHIRQRAQLLHGGRGSLLPCARPCRAQGQPAPVPDLAAVLPRALPRRPHRRSCRGAQSARSATDPQRPAADRLLARRQSSAQVSGRGGARQPGAPRPRPCRRRSIWRAAAAR